MRNRTGRSRPRGGVRRRTRPGRVMSALSSLGSRLTGIVTTTDNGGSTGRIRRSEGGIARAIPVTVSTS